MPRQLGNIYRASFVFSLGLSLAAYVNSTFLAGYLGDNNIGLVYSAGALATIIVLSFIGRVLNRYGNKFVALIFLFILIAALFIFSVGASPIIIACMFILYSIADNIVNFTFDIFVRHYSTSKITGRTRGLYLTIFNTAWLIGPFVATIFLAGKGSFSYLYVFVLLLLVIVAFLINRTVTHFIDRRYERLPILTSLKYVRGNRNIFRIVLVNFVLQFFYAWMVVYTPLYLSRIIGLSWPAIGIIFTIMLLPFALFQYPLGVLFDRYGEKRFIIVGLIIMSGATFILSFVGGTYIWLWALVLFLTRLGACTVEIGVETYFFKKVNDAEAGVIGVLRDMRPLAYLIAPLFATILLAFGNFTLLYTVLSFIILSIIPIAMRLHDTRHEEVFIKL